MKVTLVAGEGHVEHEILYENACNEDIAMVVMTLERIKLELLQSMKDDYQIVDDTQEEQQ